MAKKEEINLNLPSVDDLFTTQKERDEEKLKKIYEIPLEEIDDFPNHPYKVKDDEDMMNLAEEASESMELLPLQPSVEREMEDMKSCQGTGERGLARLQE